MGVLRIKKRIQQQKHHKRFRTKSDHLKGCDAMSHKQVHTDVSVDDQNVSKYLLVCQTQDYGLEHEH